MGRLGPQQTYTALSKTLFCARTHFKCVSGELNTCHAVSAVNCDWWRVDGHSVISVWLGLSTLMLWKLTCWHQTLCSTFLNDKRQRVGIQPSMRKMAIHGNHSFNRTARRQTSFWSKQQQTGCLTGSQLLRYCIAEWGGALRKAFIQLWVRLIHKYLDPELNQKGLRERQR